MAERTVLTFAAPAKPEADPLPWLTESWRSVHCFTMDSREALETVTRLKTTLCRIDAFSPESVTLAAIKDSVQSTVAGLQDDRHIYRVAFGERMQTSVTDLNNHLVVVGTKALTDPTLTEGQRAAILTGLAYHEVGHIRYSRDWWPTIEQRFASDKSLAATVANVGEDNRIESRMLSEFGGLKDALATAMWFVTRDQVIDLIAKGITFPVVASGNTPKDRLQCLSLYVRYPWIGDWTEAMDEALWLDAWKHEFISADTARQCLDLVQKAIDWIKAAPMVPEKKQPKPTEGEQPKEQPEQGDDDSDESEDGEGNPAPGDEPDQDDPENYWQSDHGDPFADDDDDADDSGEDSDKSESDDESDEGESDSDDESDESDSDSDDGSAAPPDDLSSGAGEGDGKTPSDESEAEDDEGDDVDEGDSDDDEAPPRDKMPDLPSDCTSKAARDPKRDDAADVATEAHERGRKDVERMRRYPHAVSNGQTVLVRERRLVRSGGNATLFMATAGLGEQANITDPAAQDAANQQGSGIDLTRWGSGGKFHTTENASKASALAAALTTARHGANAPERFQRSGRIDRGRLARVASGDPRVFTKRGAPAPQRIRCYMVLDRSSSMSDEPRNPGAAYGRGPVPKTKLAVQAGRDLITAFDQVPWLSAAVYAHTEDGIGPFVTRLWETGQPRQYIDEYMSLPMGGTPEGYALAYVADDLLDDLRPSERGMVMILSDGMPESLHVDSPDHVKAVVEYYRQRGLRVVSVSLDPALGEDAQRKMYGKDFLPYDPNVSVFARHLSRVIGSTI